MKTRDVCLIQSTPPQARKPIYKLQCEIPFTVCLYPPLDRDDFPFSLSLSLSTHANTHSFSLYIIAHDISLDIPKTSSLLLIYKVIILRYMSIYIHT